MCPSTAYEGYQTPSICLKLRFAVFKVVLELQPLQKGVTWLPPVTKGFWGTPQILWKFIMGIVWWWIHVLIHIIWRFPNTLYVHCRGWKHNSLTHECVIEGTKHSHSEDFLLAKHTSYKHPHHDEPFFRLAAWFPWMKTPHPREPLHKGLGEAAIEGFRNPPWQFIHGTKNWARQVYHSHTWSTVDMVSHMPGTHSWAALESPTIYLHCHTGKWWSLVEYVTTRWTLSWEGFPTNHGYYCFNIDVNSILPRALFKQGRSYQACVEQGKYSDGCLSNGNILSTHRDCVISSPSSILPCIASCKCSLIFKEREPSTVGSHHQCVNCSCWSGAYNTFCNVVTSWPLSLSSHSIGAPFLQWRTHRFWLDGFWWIWCYVFLPDWTFFGPFIPWCVKVLNWMKVTIHIALVWNISGNHSKWNKRHNHSH